MVLFTIISTDKHEECVCFNRLIWTCRHIEIKKGGEKERDNQNRVTVIENLGVKVACTLTNR